MMMLVDVLRDRVESICARFLVDAFVEVNTSTTLLRILDCSVSVKQAPMD